MPGDDYNRRGPDWLEIIGAHGWSQVWSRDSKRYWRRPGKEGPGWSGTTGVCTSKDGAEFLAIFSSNAAPFDGPKDGRVCTCYTKFAAYTFLNHGGEFKAAAKALGDQGYGEQSPRLRHGPRSRQPAGAEAQGASHQPPAHALAWETPIALSAITSLPDFPAHCLPGWLKSWTIAEAIATQTPPDLPALLALAVAGAGLAKKVRVRIRPGWSEPTNLFTVVALPPGDRKSAVFADALKPVHEYESDELERMRPIIAEARSQQRILEARLTAIEEGRQSEGRRRRRGR